MGTIFNNPNGHISRDFFAGDPNYMRWNRENLSLGYTVNSHVQFRLQANNLLDTPLKTYQNNVPDRLGRYDYYGRRFLFDVTFKY